MNLHTTDFGWTTYNVMSPRNTPTNFHCKIVDGVEYLTDRVTPETATHVTIVEAEGIPFARVGEEVVMHTLKVVSVIVKELSTDKIIYQRND